jgi:hypothetical protein
MWLCHGPGQRPLCRGDAVHGGTQTGHRRPAAPRGSTVSKLSPDHPISASGAEWPRLADCRGSQPEGGRRKRRRTGCFALFLSPVLACLMALAVVGVRSQPLSGILAIVALACFAVSLGSAIDLLLLAEPADEKRMQEIASWPCPACGEPYGLQSCWTGWAIGGRDLLHVDKSEWSAEARTFPATGHVTLRCAHCGSEAGFLERNGRGVHIPPLSWPRLTQ